MTTDFATRVRFVTELARRLHEYGTAAPRLEAAIDNVSFRLGLVCNSLSTPTSIILSFSDRAKGGDAALVEHTEVIRLQPGEVNLRRLSQADAIADRVYTGQLDIAEGYEALRAVGAKPTRGAERLTALSYGLASGMVAALLEGSWPDVAVAASIGFLIGWLALLTPNRPHFAASFEAIAALVAGFLVALVHTKLVPVTVNSVVIAGLIVLAPGLMLTTAVNELANQHLVSGVARLAGALAILLKLAFGTMAAMQIAQMVGLDTTPVKGTPVPGWAQLVALVAGSFAFCVLFRASWRDYPLVMASCWLSYLATRLAGAWFGGGEFAVFFAGLVVASAANLYGRLANRPGALVRVPGIILLVPGSVGFKSLFFAFGDKVQLGVDTAVTMLALLISLVAGLLFGNVLVPPRRSLS